MPQTERLAFDTRFYQDLPPEQARRRLRADAVAYLMEADTSKSPEERMTHIQYSPTKDEKDFICSADKERTLERFHNHSVSKRIFARFLETDHRLLGLWISGPDPSNNEPEGRINVYIGHKEDKGLDYFPIAIKQDDNWDEEKYLKTAQRFSQHKFEDIDDLRRTPLFLEISKDDDPIEILAECIDMPSSLWRAITSGRSKKEMVKVKRRAKSVIDRHFDRLAARVSYEEGIRRAARFERELMKATGRTISGFGSGCGASNNELLKINSFGLSSGPGQEVNFHKETTGVYIETCGACGSHIGEYMIPGKSRCPNCGRKCPKNIC